MKTCKSCIKEMDDSATKCPYCHSYQIWYKNPANFGMFIGLIPLILFIGIFYPKGSLWGKDYIGHENLFEIKEINHIQGENNRLAINYLITNNSDEKWRDINYEVSFFDSNGNLLFVKNGQEYAWLVQPKQSSHLTVKTDNSFKAEKWSLKILNLKSGWF